MSELEEPQVDLLQTFNFTSVETEALREKDVLLALCLLHLSLYDIVLHVSTHPSEVLPQAEDIYQISEGGGYDLPALLSRRVDRRDKGGGGLWKVPPGVQAHRRVLLGMIPCHTPI